MPLQSKPAVNSHCKKITRVTTFTHTDNPMVPQQNKTKLRATILCMLKASGWKVTHICKITMHDVASGTAHVGYKKKARTIPHHVLAKIKEYLGNTQGMLFEEWRPAYGPWLFNSSKTSMPICRQTVHSILNQCGEGVA